MVRNVRKRSCSDTGTAEQLPLEVIGEVLSRVGVARHVVRASLTCRKWREAYSKHLHTLSFDVADDERVYCRLPTSNLEILITRTIFQTSGLRKLSIRMNDNHKFSAVAAFGWLMFTRETLSELFYAVHTSPSINVLNICGRKKLETLCLCKCTIRGVEPVFQRFPCLTSLSLNCVSISVEDLNRLLLALPKLECLELSGTDLRAVDEIDIERILKLHFPALKTLLIIDLTELGLILEKCDIGYLRVKNCTFGLFKVTGSKSLRRLKISGSEFRLLEIEEGDNLESLEIVHSRVSESNLFPMKVQAPKLKMLRIWGFMEQMECFNRENEIVLQEKDQGFLEDLSEQTSTMFEMMRKYPHIEVKFTYMYRTCFRIY